MPFDGNDFRVRIDALETLDRVIDLLRDENRWCKGALNTVDGRRCVLGAMQAVSGAMILKEPILQAIHEVTGKRERTIENFNDRRATTHAKVISVLHRARADILEGSYVTAANAGAAQASWFRRLLGRV